MKLLLLFLCLVMVSARSTNDRLCGKRLVERMRNLCETVIVMEDQPDKGADAPISTAAPDLIPPEIRRTRRDLADCCLNICTVEELKRYCY